MLNDLRPCRSKLTDSIRRAALPAWRVSITRPLMSALSNWNSGPTVTTDPPRAERSALNEDGPPPKSRIRFADS
ncbi:MAG: hypothetical protein ACKVG6_07280 [Alphaproteobacteria bacterium]